MKGWPESRREGVRLGFACRERAGKKFVYSAGP